MGSIPQNISESGFVVGVDVATSTGYAVLNNVGKLFQLNADDAPKKLGRFQRWGHMRSALAGILLSYAPKLVVFEGYGHPHQNVSSFVTLVEYGAIVRSTCFRLGVPFIEVPPTSLKAFVGSGSAKKDQMRLEVYKTWGIEHPSNDAIDAYALAQIGRAVLGWVDMTKRQQEIIKKCVKSESVSDIICT